MINFDETTFFHLFSLLRFSLELPLIEIRVISEQQLLTAPSHGTERALAPARPLPGQEGTAASWHAAGDPAAPPGIKEPLASPARSPTPKEEKRVGRWLPPHLTKVAEPGWVRLTSAVSEPFPPEPPPPEAAEDEQHGGPAGLRTEAPGPGSALPLPPRFRSAWLPPPSAPSEQRDRRHADPQPGAKEQRGETLADSLCHTKLFSPRTAGAILLAVPPGSSRPRPLQRRCRPAPQKPLRPPGGEGWEGSDRSALLGEGFSLAGCWRGRWGARFLRERNCLHARCSQPSVHREIPLLLEGTAWRTTPCLLKRHRARGGELRAAAGSVFPFRRNHRLKGTCLWADGKSHRKLNSKFQIWIGRDYCISFVYSIQEL